MKRNLLVLALLAMPALAQSEYNGHGTVLFGVDVQPDRTDRIMTLGAGAEAFIWKGLAGGAELAYIAPRGEFRGGGAGLLSVNPAYHFTDRTRQQKLVPFVTGGWSLGFRSGTANFFNWGGGVTYWMGDRVGVRFELRDYRNRDYTFMTALRVGFTWR